MEEEPKLELKQEQLQIPPDDLEENIKALEAMAGRSITTEQWGEILTSEQVIGNGKLLNALYDYLLKRGNEIQTAKQLQALVQQLKEQK